MTGKHIGRVFDTQTGEVFQITPQLRFVKRDGRFILQQMWQEIHLGTERWRDVPLVSDE